VWICDSPREKVYFYQENSRDMVKKADPDLCEYDLDPVPWKSLWFCVIVVVLSYL
jgi:hypothetical protein